MHPGRDDPLPHVTILGPAANRPHRRLPPRSSVTLRDSFADELWCIKKCPSWELASAQSTVKAVMLDADRQESRVLPHQGRPLEIVDELVRDVPPGSFFGVSGRLGHISEVAATEAALDYVGDQFDAVASLGGEAFVIYLLKGTRIVSVLSHNKCAAGSGEFLVQQVGRLGLDLATAIERSFGGQVVPLASRCSVHCKSDITHKLNRQEASTADILRTLHDSMANKVVSLLEKALQPINRLLIVGGVGQNRAMIAALRDKACTHTSHRAAGESLFRGARDRRADPRAEPLYHAPRLSLETPFGTLPRLDQYADRVTLVPNSETDPSMSGTLVLGIDVGSTTTKAVLIDPHSRGIVASHYGRTAGDPLEAAADVCAHSWSKWAIGRSGSWGPPARPANSLVATWVRLTSTTRSLPRRLGRPILTRRWTRSSRSAGRTPSTSSFATVFRSTTR